MSTDAQLNHTSSILLCTSIYTILGGPKNKQGRRNINNGKESLYEILLEMR